MGNIKRVLALKELDREINTPYHFGMELCENVHFHRRNVRYDMSVVEALFFKKYFEKLGEIFEQEIEKLDYKEGDPEFSRYFKTLDVMELETHYFPTRLSIELEVDGSIHFHYRDLRLHWKKDEFLVIAHAMAEALEEYKDCAATPIIKLKEGLQKVPIKWIMAYDDGHRPGAEDERHRKVIEEYKQDIIDGKPIEPLIIRPNGLRLQGFCRYLAWKELGYDEVECIVVAGEDKGIELHNVVDIDRMATEMTGKAALIVPETGTEDQQVDIHTGGGLLDLGD